MKVTHKGIPPIPWQKVWRDGVAPNIPTKGLQALRWALEHDDPRLIQGATTTPPPMECVQNWPCEAGCLVSYPFAFDDPETSPVVSNKTVGETEEWFAKICFEADQAIGEPAGVRYLLNWFDDTPREQMRQELLEEVNLTLKGRETK